ncbi:MAG TPA: uracil-DNA glycosylase [Bacteroidia bacterium]|jgi:uracil-DNA glycosylase|nr:uracil-DNA glycosylase [Bacteroidia bacterium]
MVSPKIEQGWLNALNEEFTKPYFADLKSFLIDERKQHAVFPPGKRIFAAFDLTPLDKVKVVILGQDPYHGEGQANGLCFSVADGIRKPPSLINIFKELHDDTGCNIPESGNLEPWAKQGVFLLNATLTVRANSAGSHQNKGWELFTDAVIKILSDKEENLVFLLWGNYAKAKTILINADKHLVLTAAHPSPLARGAFFGSKPFSKTNAYLKSKGIAEVNWCLP